MTRSTLDAVAAVEGDGAAQKAGGGRGPLVCEHLDVGEPGGVIDADVHELPALRRPAPAGAPVGLLGLALAGHAVPGAP